jgi:hypothetical protein
MLIGGRCHCGNIAFRLDWPGEAEEIPARACDCSFCTRHGGIWTSNPQAKLIVTVEHPQLVSKYAFGTRTATFHVCARCGTVPLVTSEIDGGLYAVVNVNTFEKVDPARVRRAAVTFEGEAPASRLARRKRNWIGDVRFEGAATA